MSKLANKKDSLMRVYSWGQRIRTSTNCSRDSRPTIRRAPTIPAGHILPCTPREIKSIFVISAILNMGEEGATSKGKSKPGWAKRASGFQLELSRGKIFERSGIETWTTVAKRTVSAIKRKARKEAFNWYPIRDPGT